MKLTLELTKDGYNFTGYVLNDTVKEYFIQSKRNGHFSVYKIGSNKAMIKSQVSYTEALKTLNYVLELEA
jgi:hypothetical protein